MRIPPYYRHPSWQRFFAGVVIGALISWGFFLYTYGYLEEKHVEIIMKQKKTIQELNNEINIWREDVQKLNDRNEQLLTVQSIKIHIRNSERYKLDKMMEYDIKKHIEEDLADLMAKDIESVINTRDLITKTIENESFTIEDHTFKLKVSQLVISTVVIVEIEIMKIG